MGQKCAVRMSGVNSTPSNNAQSKNLHLTLKGLRAHNALRNFEGRSSQLFNFHYPLFLKFLL